MIGLTEPVRHAEMVRQTWRSGFSRPSDIEFRELLERLPAAAYTTDADGLITWYNRDAVELWGREPALHDPVDRYCGSFKLYELDGTPIDHAACWMALALRDRKPYNGFEILVERPDGSRRIALAHANPIFAGDRLAAAVNVLVDITERKEAEVALRRANEAKSRFLAVLAHELRNPLAPMRSAVDVLRRTTDPEMAERARATLDRQLSHLTRIVDDLIDISRITHDKLELRLEPIDLASVMRQAAEVAEPMMEARQQELTVTLPDEPIWVAADSARLAQLVGNLLVNASKYSDSGSDVDLALERLGSDAIVAVRDQGIGIASDTIPAIFDLFERGTQLGSTDGLGVGLTLARQLAEMHGGFIEARSQGPGTGSEFRVHLPALETAPTPRPAEPDATDRPSGIVGRRILVVDDNRDAADALAELLELEGAEVMAAHDGAEALDIAAAFRPEVVLLDIGLPRLDGYEVARRLRATRHGRAAMLVALTGWGQSEDRARSAEAGFDHHLVKPVDLSTISSLLASPVEAPPTT